MNKLKTKLLASWMDALYIGYLSSINAFEPEDAHELLLLEHAREILGRLSTQLLNDQQRYTLTLTGTEALAFLQWWSINPCESGSLIQVVVAELMKKIDLTAKAPKRMLYGL